MHLRSLPPQSLALLVTLASSPLIGCDAPAPVADAGSLVSDAPLPRPDAGPPPPPYACDGEITMLDGVLGETASLTFDISMTPERPRDLGGCGNTSTTATWSGQEIIEYHVPGTGTVGVTFDTRLSGTAANFNTLVQLRTECPSIPTTRFPPTCFDDSGSDPRSSGGFTAMGGDTVYLVVTAFSDPPAIDMEIDEGPLAIEITPTANTPPTLESASALLYDDAALFEATATDAEGPILGYALALFTAAGQVDFDGDGMREAEDVLIFPFDSVVGTAPYVGRGEITPMADGYQIATFCRAAGCTGAGIAVFDASYAMSASLRVPVNEATFVGTGDACDAANRCTAGLECTAGLCTVGTAAAAICAGAVPIPIAMPVDAMPVVASVTGTVGAGAGVFLGTCAGATTSPSAVTPGRETVYSIELTGTGPYDLTLTTARPATGMADTVLYVRTDCADETSELMCIDDVGMVLQSSLTLPNLAPGTYFVFVEDYGGVATGSTAFELQATLTL